MSYEPTSKWRPSSASTWCCRPSAKACDTLSAVLPWLSLTSLMCEPISVSVSERRRRASRHTPARLAASLLERVAAGNNRPLPDRSSSRPSPWQRSSTACRVSVTEDSESRKGREGLTAAASAAAAESQWYCIRVLSLTELDWRPSRVPTTSHHQWGWKVSKHTALYHDLAPLQTFLAGCMFSLCSVSFFFVIPCRSIISNIYRTNFQDVFSSNGSIWSQFGYLTFFPIAQGTLPWQPILW